MPKFIGIDYSGVPVGSIIDLGHGTIPPGFLPCDGSVVSQATYPLLYAKIGTNFNTGGEGAGNFRLPDSRRRVHVGDGGTGTATLGNAIGNSGGAETHLLSADESGLRDHAHTFPVNTSASTQGQPGGLTGLYNYTVHYPPNWNHPVNGSGPMNAALAHNNMQPSLVVKKAIAYL